jgi:aspartyl-tRNA(Asn)/glutamyl-tRNA(Gln) amidotransferase subunit A
MSAPLVGLGAAGIARRVRAGEVSATEVVSEHLAHLEATEPTVHAWLHTDREAALARAGDIDARIAQGEDPGPLAGVPVALKDNLCTRGAPTTAASKILAGWRPPYDATVCERLRAAGAVPLGKTNLDEFAMGSSTEHSAFGATRNPWDPSRVPGGSSGGSAAAVAAGNVPLALGSDTGGSIRQPAALCGVVGLKPTYGAVSRYGLLAFASSLDQIGPIARSVEDAALCLEVIGGHDTRDATSIPKPAQRLLDGLGAFPPRLRVGVVREFEACEQDAGVRRRVEEAVQVLRGLGAEVVEVELPRTSYGIATYYILAPAECSSNLARYDGVHHGHRAAGPAGIVDLYSRSRGEGFGAEVKRRIFLGTYVLSSGFYDAYYLRAQKARRLIWEDFRRAFEGCDVIAGPASPTTAFPLGSRTEDPLRMYAADVFTVTANLAGVPGISVPCGLDDAGLPVGLQLLAPWEHEARLLQVAHAYERARGPMPFPRVVDAGAGAGSGA